MASLNLLQENDAVHSLPPFANDENKGLSEKIKAIESKLSQINNELEDNGSRAEIMSSHMKNVKQELTHTQAIHDAKCRQLETEDHFKQLADRECGRLTKEIQRFEKEIAEITDRLTLIQNNIYRGNEKIESIRTELKFEKDELDEWLQVQSEKEEDNVALLKYTKEDDAKIKELSLATEKLMQEVNKKKAQLSAEVTETQISQIELDKVTETFKKLHQDRQSLIDKWDAAIKSMQKSDQDIENAQEKYNQLRNVIKDKMDKIKEKQKFLDEQVANNSDLEKKISVYDRVISTARLEQSEASSNLLAHRDEADIAKTTLNKTASTLVARKTEVTNLRLDLDNKHTQLAKENERNEQLKTRFSQMKMNAGSMVAKALQLQQIIKEQEKRNKDLERELKMLKEQQFKRNQELFKLKTDEKNTVAQINCGETALHNLKSKLQLLDQESLKQQAMLYAQEYQVQQMERKVRRAQGERSDEEKEILSKKIHELTSQSEAQNKRFVILSSQLKKAQDDLRQAKRKQDLCGKDKQYVTDSINELRLYTESAANQLHSKVKEKEELMVEENIRRLEIRKLRGFLNARADEVFGLESRQVGLQLALQARTKEIEIHKDILRVQIKTADEERQSATSELRERVSKIEKLKKRYEILMTHFAPNSGEEEHSQAFYVIKAAQEREQLQQEGDKLDASIRKAEKEIRALENTLILMNNRNEDYRSNLYKAELDSKDVQHKEMLETQYRHVMEQYRAKREIIQDYQQRLMDMERSLSEINETESNKLQTVQILQAKLQQLQKEISQLDVKSERAKKAITKASLDFRRKIGVETKELLPEENDFMIRKAKELGSIVLAEVTKIAEKIPSAHLTVEEIMEKNGLRFPSRTVSRVSSRASSIRDDASDVSYSSSVGNTKRSILIQSRGLYRPVRDTNPAAQTSGTSTPTFSKRLSINDMAQLPMRKIGDRDGRASAASARSQAKKNKDGY